jgi:hypothetical protein
VSLVFSYRVEIAATYRRFERNLAVVVPKTNDQRRGP